MSNISDSNITEYFDKYQREYDDFSKLTVFQMELMLNHSEYNNKINAIHMKNVEAHLNEIENILSTHRTNASLSIVSNYTKDDVHKYIEKLKSNDKKMIDIIKEIVTQRMDAIADVLKEVKTSMEKDVHSVNTLETPVSAFYVHNNDSIPNTYDAYNPNKLIATSSEV